MIKALLFDLDGVLIEAVVLHYAAFTKALRGVAGVHIGEFEHTALLDGLSTRQKLAALVERGTLQANLVDKVYEVKQGLTVKYAHALIKPDPVKIDMVNYYAERYSLVCVSNCIRDSVNLLLSLAGLYEQFPISVSNEDVAHPKPAPDPYWRACSLLGLSAEECVAIEDNANGIASARAAGVPVIATQYDELNLQFMKEKINELL